MNREKKFIKNTVIIAIGKICSQLITFLLLPLYTSVLSTEEYGIVDLLNTLVGLAIPIIILQIEQATFRLLIDNRNNPKNTKAIISTTIVSILIQVLIFAILFLILGRMWSNHYKYYLFANIIAYIFPTVLLQIARGIDNTKVYSIGSFIIAFSTIIYNILFVLILDLKAEGMLLGTMLGQITCSIYVFLKLKIYKYITIRNCDKNILKELLSYSLPLIPNSISWWVFNASDRLIVSTVLGLSATGILAAANKFSALYISAYAIIYMSWTETIALYFKEANIEEYFNKMLNVLMRMFISVAVCIIAFMPIIYKLFINDKFYEGYNLTPILLIAAIFNVFAGLVGAIYVARKDTKSIANTSIISAIINFIVNICLIKFMGLYAAALSTLAAYLIMSVYRIYDLRKKNFNVKIHKNVIINSLIAVILICIQFYMNILPLTIASMSISLLWMFLFNKNSINYFIHFIKEKIRRKY